MCPKRSCKTISTTVSEMASSNYTNADKVSPTVILNFLPTVQVTKSIPKVTFVTVINDIGSSMGLWLGESVFSIFKMVQIAPTQCCSSNAACECEKHAYYCSHYNYNSIVHSCWRCLLLFFIC